MTNQPKPADRRERYATAIHDAMEPDLSLGDQEPAYQALIARAAEAAEALADAEQNRQVLTTLANLGIATHRLDRIRDAARLHRQQLLGTSELYAVIEADDAPAPAAVSAAVAPPTNDTDPELTAEEARTLADDLGLQLYRAQDALAFVAECCDIADQEQRTVTTADVREWLKGARCGRQLAADAADQTALRERAARALYGAHSHIDVWDQADEHTKAVVYAEVDAVLAVLPEPTDRAAVLREADWIVEHCPDHGCVEPATEVCHCEIADRLRRMADETATETPVADATHPCNAATMHRLGNLATAHGPHLWVMQPGMDPVRCPGTRKPAAGARQDGAES